MSYSCCLHTYILLLFKKLNFASLVCNLFIYSLSALENFLKLVNEFWRILHTLSYHSFLWFFFFLYFSFWISCCFWDSRLIGTHYSVISLIFCHMQILLGHVNYFQSTYRNISIVSECLLLPDPNKIYVIYVYYYVCNKIMFPSSKNKTAIGLKCRLSWMALEIQESHE